MAFPVNFNALIQALLGAQGGGAGTQQPTATDPALTAILSTLLNPASAAPAAGPAAAAPAAGSTFMDYLNQMYPGVTGWAPAGDLMNSGPKGNFQDVGNPALGTEWSAMFTPPAGDSRTPYPIYVAGPSSMTAASPFAMPGTVAPRAGADREN